MHCPVCGHQNQPGSRFCAQCGSELVVTCPACSTTSTPDARFCRSCGTALGEDPSTSEEESLAQLIPPELLSKLRSARAGQAMRGERRTVTMLFADVQGSTAAAEQLDPEDWADLMNSAFERLIEPIYRYEGTLARLLGDAVLAFFGAPIAHEDDPIRAIRAGLDIIEGMAACRAEIEERHGIPIDVRVGINTGLVVVGEVGSDLRVEYTALGDAINVAARMEQTAEPGTVQVSEHTLSLTKRAFAAMDLGLVDLKGKAEPIRTYRPTAYLGTVAGDVGDHGFFGREDELERLTSLITRLQAGSGWIASIIGEAGLGKSALMREWERATLQELAVARHPFDNGELAAMTGSSQSYDASKPMSGFRTVLERWFAFDGNADFDKVRRATAGIDHPDLAALVGHVAGVELPDGETELVEGLDPPILLARARAAVVAYLEGEAARRPMIVAFEDLHWSDDLTIDLMADLLATTEAAPIGIAVAMRPYRDDPSWRVHEQATREHAHRYERIELQPLAGEPSEALLRDMLGDLSLDQAELQSVLARSAGNPLFLEEIATSLAGGGSVGGVPDSLAGVLAARLDRLDEHAHLVAQVSSVLGTEFRRDMIAALVPGDDLTETITELLRQGVFVESRNAPGHLGFRHALLQDAAYASVLLKTRRRLHGEVARHLAATNPEAAPDMARHFVAAEEYDEAFPHLVESGSRATRAMALADAIRDLRLALEHVPDGADEELVQRAHLSLGETYALLPDLSESAAAFQRLFDYGEERERPTAQVAALNHLGFTTATVGGDFAKANEYLRQARILAEQVGDERGLIEYHMNACMVAAFEGDPEAAAEHDTQTAELGAAVGDDRIRVEGLRRRAMNHALGLDFAAAASSLELATAAADQLGSARALAELQVLGRGLIAFGHGDYPGAIEVIDSQFDTLERFASFDLPISHAIVGHAQLELGLVEEALASFAETRRTGSAGGQPFSDGLGAAGMAAVYAVAGLADESGRAREEARIGEGPMGDYFASSSWANIGLAHLLLDEPREAEDAFSMGLAAPAVVQYLDRTRLLAGLAMALAAKGDPERAETVLSEAREFADQRAFRATDDLLVLAEGAVRAAAGDDPLPSFRQALSMADEQGHRLIALRAARALGDAAPAWASEVERRAGEIAEGVVDPTLAAGIRNRWASARSGA